MQSQGCEAGVWPLRRADYSDLGVILDMLVIAKTTFVKEVSFQMNYSSLVIFECLLCGFSLDAYAG